MDSHFVSRPPAPHLTHAVHELWDFQRPGDRAWHGAAPKPYVELVFNLDAPFAWRAAPGAAPHRFHDAWITPLQSGRREARPEGAIRLVGARLYPAAARAVFGPLPGGDGAPPKALGPRDAWSAATRRALLAAADAGERLSVLETALLPRFVGVPSAATPGLDVDSVRMLAARLGMDVRGTHRRLSRDTGVSPKRWLRLARLDRVLRDPALADCTTRIADLAYRHGFSDHAHLAREFRLLLGQTPRQLRGGARADPTAPPHYLGATRRIFQAKRPRPR
jgi:AraC-like DNA-binding protein